MEKKLIMSCGNAGQCKLLIDQAKTSKELDVLMQDVKAMASAIVSEMSGNNASISDSEKELQGLANGGDVGKLAETMARISEILAKQREFNDHVAESVTNMAVKLQEENERLQTDQLTGLYNRHRYDKDFENLKNEFEKLGKPFAFAILDIDDFKKINDTYNHTVGDAVLRYLAKTLTEHFDAGHLYRFGGEEFLIMFPGTKEELAEMVGKALAFLNKTKLMFKQKTHIPLTFSAGVADFLKGDDGDDTYLRADEAMFVAKKGGKNRVHVA